MPAAVASCTSSSGIPPTKTTGCLLRAVLFLLLTVVVGSTSGRSMSENEQSIDDNPLDTDRCPDLVNDVSLLRLIDDGGNGDSLLTNGQRRAGNRHRNRRVRARGQRSSTTDDQSQLQIQQQKVELDNGWDDQNCKTGGWRSPDDSLENRTLCPWTWSVDEDPNRVPRVLHQAKCLCDRVRVPAPGIGTGEVEYECEQLKYTVNVLRPVEGNCRQFRLQQQRVALGCVPVRQAAITIAGRQQTVRHIVNGRRM